MKRFLVLAFLLWSGVFVWSSNASAESYPGNEGAVVTLYTYKCDLEWCRPAYDSQYGEWSRVMAEKDAAIAECEGYDNLYSCADYGLYYGSPPGANGYTVSVRGTIGPVQVECNAPNYIDPETNECVPPEEVCFTSIESMADRCVFIGETTPDAPPGCIRDEETQAEICLSENEGCYVADGKEICPTPGMVCGVKNGTFSCVAPEQEGCGYFNGERVCFTPDGDKVEPDSPDHPDNGGNLDGDDTNDPTDPRTPEEGGNPDNQPIDTTGQGEGATEGTAKEQLKALRQLRDEAVNQNKANTGNGAALEQGISSDIDSAGDSAAGVLDGHITDIDSPGPMEGDDLSTIGGAVTGIFGAPAQCQDISFGVDELSYTITCADGEKIRDLLGFLLYVFTVIRLFNVATRPAAAGTP